MDTTAIVVVVAVALVLLAGAVLVARPMMRRRRLQSRFGSEYDRAVQRHEDRSAAEQELMERERRHAELDIRPLSADSHARYSQQWRDVQERFVDEPEKSVRDADRLLTALMAERGYPTDGSHDEQMALLSIDHAKTLDQYRTAHETHQRIGDGEVSTENLREAMVQYRALFVDLLGSERHEDRQDHADTDGRVDGRVDGQVDDRIDGRVDGRVDGRGDGHRHGLMDGLRDRLTGGRTGRDGHHAGNAGHATDQADAAPKHAAR